VHLVTCGHFRSCDKDGGHAIRYVVAKNPWHTKTSCCIFYRTGVMGDRSFILREYRFQLFLLLWPWPWPDDLYIRTWPVFPGNTPRTCKYKLLTLRLSKVIVWQIDRQTCIHTYIQTDRHDRNYMPRRSTRGLRGWTLNVFRLKFTKNACHYNYGRIRAFYSAILVPFKASSGLQQNKFSVPYFKSYIGKF